MRETKPKVEMKPTERITPTAEMKTKVEMKTKAEMKKMFVPLVNRQQKSLTTYAQNAANTDV